MFMNMIQIIFVEDSSHGSNDRKDNLNDNDDIHRHIEHVFKTWELIMRRDVILHYFRLMSGEYYNAIDVISVLQTHTSKQEVISIQHYLFAVFILLIMSIEFVNWTIWPFTNDLSSHLIYVIAVIYIIESLFNLFKFEVCFTI